jgi:3-methyl-2-oxobutanoate hydroxymethyltransferase
MPKITVKDLYAAKGKTPLTQIFVRTAREAAACDSAGIDMVMTFEQADLVKEARAAAPNSFLSVGMGYAQYTTPSEFLRAAYKFMKMGVDGIYCPYGMDYVAALAKEYIPVFGHIGMVPYRNSWFGGFKAVGKTVEEAVALMDLTRRYEDAGAMGIEVELVPDGIAAEISKRTKMLTVGMGAGSGCDAQYLFATDVLGDNEGHIPRHAKVYRNHRADYERLHQDSIAAFAEFKADVRSGAYPEARHDIQAQDELVQDFLAALKV